MNIRDRLKNLNNDTHQKIYAYIFPEACIGILCRKGPKYAKI